MMRLILTITLLLVCALSGCGAKSTSSESRCSSVKSILTGGDNLQLSLKRAHAGLLLSRHYDAVPANWDSGISLSKCNVSLELLDASQAKVRLWTASHCIRPLQLVSLQLALRNHISSTGGFLVWNLTHPVLAKAQIMRQAYSEFTPVGNAGAREKLIDTFNRSAMMVKDASSVLAPRTACENLRWLAPADSLHSLCFSIHDLSYLDVELPEKDSPKTINLLKSLSQNSIKSAAAEQALATKRDDFLKKIDLLSQSEWIMSQEQSLTGFLKSPQPVIPSADPLLSITAKLQNSVFSLPSADEFSFMTPASIATQDQPAGSNSTLSVIKSGQYNSPRLSDPINDVTVGCVRSLRQWDTATLSAKTVSELEYRPHAYCAGGSNPQPDHFWHRNYQWGQMVADQAVGAAREFALAVRDLLTGSGQPQDWESRLTVISNFTVDDRIDFFSDESDAVSPFLTALRFPAGFFTQQLNGLQFFSQTGALLLASNKSEARARFVKGDSGAIILLDGVPVATLYSVDGEETSGGASIRPLPSADSENADFDPLTSDAAVGSRNSVKNQQGIAPAGGMSGCL
jgi:hypothetical protein